MDFMDNSSGKMNKNSLNFTPPTDAEELVYQTVSIVIGFVDVYLLVALVTYEIHYPNKPLGGRKLRILCILAASVALFHQGLQQLIVTVSQNSTVSCFALLLLKSTILNLIVSVTYGFLWLRQHTLYSNPRLKHLRSGKMNVATWIALFLIIVNPLLVFGLQFNGTLYVVEDGVCIVLEQDWKVQLPLELLAFSYGFIMITLLVMYFYPLCKQIPPSTPNQLTQKNATLTPDQRTKINIHSTTDSAFPGSPSTASSNEEHKTCKKKSVESCLKKWIILSLICFVTDIASASVITIFWHAYAPGSLITYLFLWHDVGMVINVVCMVLCFTDYKNMLLPYRYWGKFKRNRSNSVPSIRVSASKE